MHTTAPLWSRRLRLFHLKSFKSTVCLADTFDRQEKDGRDFEIVYVADGSISAYEEKDVRGKMVLVEVSYAPPVPEKAYIAAQMGAAGIMCMNWGNDEEVICHRALKSVWGNPTPNL